LGLGLPPWNSPFHFGLLDLRQSVGLLGRVINSLQGLYLYTNTEKRTHRHPCLEWDSNPQSGFQASEDSTCLSPLGYSDRPVVFKDVINSTGVSEEHASSSFRTDD
jgi:hypothetical protein